MALGTDLVLTSGSSEFAASKKRGSVVLSAICNVALRALFRKPT